MTTYLQAFLVIILLFTTTGTIAGNDGKESSTGSVTMEDADSPAREPTDRPTEPSIAYKLAVIETGVNSSMDQGSVIVMRYQKYLSLLAEKYSISEYDVANQTLSVVQHLKEAGVETTVLDMMMSAATIDTRGAGLDYVSTISAMATLMIENAAN